MDDHLETLQRLNQGYVRAAENSDLRWYEEHLAGDFMSSNPDGSLVDRAGFLARMARPYPGSNLRAEDVRIRTLGEIAIIHAGFRYLKPDGAPGAGRYPTSGRAATGAGCASPRTSPASDTEDIDMQTTVLKRGSDLETLEQLNGNYIRSVQASDARWFDENLAEDFLNSNPDGSLVDRAGFLAQIARPCAISSLQCEDVRIRILGDIAIIHGRTTYRKQDGQPGAGRYTDVWSRGRGRWLCVAAQVTRG